METAELWLEYKLLRDKCIANIKHLMNYKDQVKFPEPIAIIKEPEVKITGVKNKKGRLLIMTRSFGLLDNGDYVPNDFFFTVQDYLSIIDHLKEY